MSSDRMLIGAFLAALVLPASWGLCHAGPFPPIKSWRTLPAQCEEWFNDHLGGRRAMLTVHGLIKVRGLRVTASRQVILGNDGWLFLDEEKQYRHAAQPDADRQAELWRRGLERRRDWLAARGVYYLVLVVPEKATVYPEQLPDRLRRTAAPSALDRLFAGWPADDLAAVDLRDHLFAAKPIGPLYYRTDTHWNAAGTAVALRATLDKLGHWFPTVLSGGPPVAPIADAPFDRGDLARMLGLGGWLGEQAPAVCRDGPRSHPPLWDTGRDDLPDVLLFHDSFGDALIPGLAGHCRRLVCLPTVGIDPVAVGRYRPQVVIQELAERTLTWWEPADPDRR